MAPQSVAWILRPSVEYANDPDALPTAGMVAVNVAGLAKRNETTPPSGGRPPQSPQPVIPREPALVTRQDRADCIVGQREWGRPLGH